MPTTPRLPLLSLLSFLPLFSAGCGGEAAGSGSRWAGTMDTLPSGQVVVTNPAQGAWDSSSAWRVVEELRIGTLEGDGPDLFGDVQAVEIDPQERIWVLEGQSQELRMFDREGRHVRTIGRKGGGPGDFAQPLGMAWSAAGELWVPDPENNRISVIDTAGSFVGSRRMIGGFIWNPWPGRFDTAGFFYNYMPDVGPGRDFKMYMVRYDTLLNPLDSLVPPEWQGGEEYFEFASPDGRSRWRTGVPYTPGLDWRLSPAGDFWFVHTGSYELFRVTPGGDTVRNVTKAFEQVPVTGEDVDSAMARLDGFIKRGGKVDRSRIPGVKPAVRQFFVADDGYLWVEPTTPNREDQGRLFEVFDPEGRYLGRVRLPFQLSGTPPVIRGDLFVAVVQDELEVPFVVRARIVKPAETEDR
jgi:hypothetical protein